MMLRYNSKRYEVERFERRDCFMREVSEVGGLQAESCYGEETRVPPLGLLG